MSAPAPMKEGSQTANRFLCRPKNPFFLAPFPTTESQSHALKACQPPGTGSETQASSCYAHSDPVPFSLYYDRDNRKQTTLRFETELISYGMR